MEDLRKMKRETIRLICKCDNVQWIWTIYTYVKRLIG